MKLFITCGAPAAVLVCGESSFAAGTNETIFNLEDTRQIVTLFPAQCGGARLLPIAAEIDHGTEPIGGMGRSGGVPFRCFDWGGYGLELAVDFLELPAGCASPRLLAAADYPGRDGAPRRVELYSDCGLRLLERRDTGEEMGYLLSVDDGCRFESAELRQLDIGSERLLTARLFAQDAEKILVFNRNLELLLDILGDECVISDGYITSVTKLGTILGHEKRQRFDFRHGGIAPLPAETGFFAGKRRQPEGAAETALAFAECIALSRPGEALALLDRGLQAALKMEDLTGFLGKFSTCRSAPAGMNVAESALIGLCGEGVYCPVRVYEFSFENGKISDIVELGED